MRRNTVGNAVRHSAARTHRAEQQTGAEPPALADSSHSDPLSPNSGVSVAPLSVQLLSLVLCACLSAVVVHAADDSMRIEVFFVKGVIYSPSPIGFHPQWTWPHGDFFIPQYADLWSRDFPLLVSLGANTLRVSGWNNDLDHGYFLDRAHAAGLKVLVSFTVGNAWQSPVSQDWQQAQTLGAFSWQVRKYLGHPALLGWVFGEGLNLPANGFLQSFSDKGNCGWNGNDKNGGDHQGCVNEADAAEPRCAASVACVYRGFMAWIEQAGAYAKNTMGEMPKPRSSSSSSSSLAPARSNTQPHLILAGVSDVDVSWMRLNQFSHLSPTIDGWALQIYRGRDFGTGPELDYLSLYERATPYNAAGELIGAPKPLLVSEYGIDAYNDPCGLGPETPCYNEALAEPHGGFGEDQSAQAEWGVSLTKLLTAHSSARSSSDASKRGAVLGGTINSFVDESWRCTQGVGGCSGPVPYPLPGFDASQCSWKAHVSCPQMNLWARSLCGYWTPATFDRYANVGWFGLLRPEPQQGDWDRLTPRLIYGKIQEHWAEDTEGFWASWGWLMMAAAALLVALALTLRARREFHTKRTQVERLEIKSNSIMGGAGGAGAAAGAGGAMRRSPAPATSSGSASLGSGGGGGGSGSGSATHSPNDRVRTLGSSRSTPAGKSSRARDATTAAADASQQQPQQQQGPRISLPSSATSSPNPASVSSAATTATAAAPVAPAAEQSVGGGMGESAGGRSAATEEAARQAAKK